MDVSAQHDCDVPRQVGGPDDIGAEAKGVIPRTARRALDALMEAEHPDVRPGCTAACSGVGLGEPIADSVCVGESDECDTNSASLENEASRPVEDMQTLVYRQQRIG